MSLARICSDVGALAVIGGSVNQNPREGGIIHDSRFVELSELAASFVDSRVGRHRAAREK